MTSFCQTHYRRSYVSLRTRSGWSSSHNAQAEGSEPPPGYRGGANTHVSMSFRGRTTVPVG